jgi:hypothetical protein
VPPSIHPSGNRYRFIQEGDLIEVPDLNRVLKWLDSLLPAAPVKAPTVSSGSIRSTEADSLIEAVKVYWPDALTVFRHFGIAQDTNEERNGEVRILGNGGLLIHADNPELWYCFSDEIGGGVFEAWGWQRFGSAYDNRRQFRQVLVEMGQAAGIDVAKFYRRGDEAIKTDKPGDRWYWTNQPQYKEVFARML